MTLTAQDAGAAASDCIGGSERCLKERPAAVIEHMAIAKEAAREDIRGHHFLDDRTRRNLLGGFETLPYSTIVSRKGWLWQDHLTRNRTTRSEHAVLVEINGQVLPRYPTAGSYSLPASGGATECCGGSLQLSLVNENALRTPRKR
jgi:hypothetical protein